MGSRALSVCIGPSMCRAEGHSPSDVFDESKVQQNLCTIILQHFKEIFTVNPLLLYGSGRPTNFYKLIQSQEVGFPYALNIPIGSVVQTVAEDLNGWCIGVYDDIWGVVHRSCLELVTKPKELLLGLCKQSKKWKLTPEQIDELSKNKVEAHQLYCILSERLRFLREQAGKI